MHPCTNVTVHAGAGRRQMSGMVRVVSFLFHTVRILTVVVLALTAVVLAGLVGLGVAFAVELHRYSHPQPSPTCNMVLDPDTGRFVCG